MIGNNSAFTLLKMENNSAIIFLIRRIFNRKLLSYSLNGKEVLKLIASANYF